MRSEDINAPYRTPRNWSPGPRRRAGCHPVGAAGARRKSSTRKCELCKKKSLQAEFRCRGESRQCPRSTGFKYGPPSLPNRVVPQQWPARTTVPGVTPDDRRRLDLAKYGAFRRGEALCCDVTLASPLRADGRPQPASSDRDGAAARGGTNNGATLNWPARARNASSSGCGGGGKRRTTSSAASTTALPACAAGAARRGSATLQFALACVTRISLLRSDKRAGSEALPRVLRAATEVDPRATILFVDASVPTTTRPGRPCTRASSRGLSSTRVSPTPASFMALTALTRGLMGRGPPTSSRKARALAGTAPGAPGGAGTAAGSRALTTRTLPYIIARPERMHELCEAYGHALWAHSRVELNSRKTRVWNAAGEEPHGLSVVQGDADTAIWVGDWALSKC